MISFIIVNYNTTDMLKGLLSSIKQYFADAEVIVVDNASRDGSSGMVKKDFPDTRIIINNDNVGFGRANNQAMEIANGDVFVLINSDAELFDDSLKKAVELVNSNKNYGLAGCRLVNTDGSTQASVSRFPNIGYAFLSATGIGLLLPQAMKSRVLAGRYFDYGQQSNVDWVMGACMIIRKEIYEKTRGFDNTYFMFGEDMEWCYRIKQAGYEIIYTPKASVKHHFNKSKSTFISERYILMYKNYYFFCNQYLGKTQSMIIRLLNIAGLSLRYAAHKLGFIRTDDQFLSYWFSNFKEAIIAQFKA